MNLATELLKELVDFEKFLLKWQETVLVVNILTIRAWKFNYHEKILQQILYYQLGFLFSTLEQAIANTHCDVTVNVTSSEFCFCTY